MPPPALLMEVAEKLFSRSGKMTWVLSSFYMHISYF